MEEYTRTSQFFPHRRFSAFPHHHHQFNAAFVSAEVYNISCSCNRGFKTILPHAPFAFLFTSMLEFLQLKYQGKKKSPFETHPILIHLGIATLLICCFLYNTELRFSSNLRYQMCARKYVHCCMVMAGSVSLACPTSILSPDSIRPVAFVFFFTLSAAEALHFVYCRVVQKLREFRDRTSRGPLLPL